MAQAMEGACSLAVRVAEVAAAQALKALAHPRWTDAVVATAAAMAADNAVSACAHSFIEQVHDQLPACFSLKHSATNFSQHSGKKLASLSRKDSTCPQWVL